MKNKRPMSSASIPCLPPAWAKPSSPLFAHLLITRACNWSCPFCVIKDNKAGHGDTDTIMRVVYRLAESGVLDLTLFGGEPLLHPDALPIGEHIARCGMQPGFVSNGDVRADPQEIASIFPQGAVSIHGMPTTHDETVRCNGAWKRSMEFLQQYVSSGGRASVCLTVGKKNLRDFPGFCTYLAENAGVVSVVVNPVIPFPGAADALGTAELEILGQLLAGVAEQLARNGVEVILGASVPFCALPPVAARFASACYAGTLFATVDSAGDLFICPERQSPVGNVLAEDLRAKWPEWNEFEEQATGSFADDPCRACGAYSWCRSTRECAVSTTDVRARGPEWAERNLKQMQEGCAVSGDDGCILAGSISLADGVRARIEPFGMFILSPSGKPLALDHDGAKLFQKIAGSDSVTLAEILQEHRVSEEDARVFLGQGIRLGLFTQEDRR